MLLFRENFVCLFCLFLGLETLRRSLLSLRFMIEIPTFALLLQNFEPYFIPTFAMEDTRKPELMIIFVPKHTLWVFIGNTSVRQFQ